MFSITRYHDFSYGHRVYGHEGQCAHLHGHNGRVHFTCIGGKLDSVGRVIDFGVVKSTLCQWLEDNWDHKMLLWDQDPWYAQLIDIDKTIVGLGFNPTAEHLAEYLLGFVGPMMLEGTGVQLVHVKFEETRKCAAEATR